VLTILYYTRIGLINPWSDYLGGNVYNVRPRTIIMSKQSQAAYIKHIQEILSYNNIPVPTKKQLEAVLNIVYVDLDVENVELKQLN